MKTVTVKAPSKTYNVHVGSGLLGTAGALARKAGVCGRAVIITDGKVDALYGQRLEQPERSGHTVGAVCFDAGEASKTPETLVRALEFTAQSGLTRTDTIYALGGGVAGDLAGLCAALYMRGIKLVQVPTTVLAAVDSSVGGKTAVDLKAGKNLAGAFYQPDFVVCDTDTFETLPDCEMANGWAEIIKYGTICDAALMMKPYRARR
jgi:3-dehydroquinate synthase